METQCAEQIDQALEETKTLQNRVNELEKQVTSVQQEKEIAEQQLEQLEGRVVMMLDVAYATVGDLHVQMGEQAVAADDEKAALKTELTHTKKEHERQMNSLEITPQSWFMDPPTPLSPTSATAATTFDNPLNSLNESSVAAFENMMHDNPLAGFCDDSANSSPNQVTTPHSQLRKDSCTPRSS